MKPRVVVFAVLGVLAMAGTARAATSPAPTANPAGIGDYSYIQVQHSQLGSSSYFGETAKSNGLEASYQFGQNVFVYGDFDRQAFDKGGNLYRTAVGIGYAQTAGKISAYLRGGFYREIASGNSRPGRSYYWQFAYGLRASLASWFAVQGELYSDIHPEFGSVPWGLKVGVAFALGPLSLHLTDDHNRQVNTLSAALRFAF
ncbi:MAG: hypothetical protein ACRETC_06625 [Gammaproteobacteria bacterium]